MKFLSTEQDTGRSEFIKMNLPFAYIVVGGVIMLVIIKNTSDEVSAGEGIYQQPVGRKSKMGSPSHLVAAIAEELTMPDPVNVQGDHQSGTE